MVVVDEADRHAMEAAEKSRIGGIIKMLTTVPDPPQAGAVKAVTEAGKRRPQENVGTVARRGTKRANAGKSVPIRTKLGRTGRIRFRKWIRLCLYDETQRS